MIKLDERQELINKIRILSVSDIRKVGIFIAGMESEREIQEENDGMVLKEKETLLKG